MASPSPSTPCWRSGSSGLGDQPGTERASTRCIPRPRGSVVGSRRLRRAGTTSGGPPPEAGSAPAAGAVRRPSVDGVRCRHSRHRSSCCLLTAPRDRRAQDGLPVRRRDPGSCRGAVRARGGGGFDRGGRSAWSCVRRGAGQWLLRGHPGDDRPSRRGHGSPVPTSPRRGAPPASRAGAPAACCASAAHPPSRWSVRPEQASACTQACRSRHRTAQFASPATCWLRTCRLRNWILLGCPWTWSAKKPFCRRVLV